MIAYHIRRSMLEVQCSMFSFSFGIYFLKPRNYPYEMEKNQLVFPYVKGEKMSEKLIQDIHALFIAAIEPIRPGRKFKRKHNRRKHDINYKPCH